MTPLLMAGALAPLSFFYQPDVRTAYVSRGRVVEDRPIQANYLRCDLDMGDFGTLGLWHWNYSSLTGRREHLHRRAFHEMDGMAAYRYGLEFSEEWRLTTEVTFCWMTFPGYRGEYRGTADKDELEIWVEQSLDNPYVVPVWKMRRGVEAVDFTYFKYGLEKPFAIRRDLTVTPCVCLESGNERLCRQRYGDLPGGGRYNAWVMSMQSEIDVNWQATENVMPFVSLLFFNILDKNARNQTHGIPRHRELVALTIGAKVSF